MDISHISCSGGKEFSNSPGLHVEGVEARNIFALITNEDYVRLTSYLKSFHYPIDIMSMRDQRNFTVLTFCAYKNVGNCFKILYEYAVNYNVNKNLSRYGQEEAIRNWVDTKADDNFTALHFAAKNGNYTMLHILVERAKADVLIMN